jgi:hypothetical protein
MQTVTRDEAVLRLPDLLREAKTGAVVISDGTEELGAIVSMDDYEVVRRAKVNQALDAMVRLGDMLREEAGQEGISVDELETMLDRHAT